MEKMNENKELSMNEEIELSDEDLNEVNGGFYSESAKDSLFLSKLGKRTLCLPHSEFEFTDSKCARRDVKYAWRRVGVDFIDLGKKPNEYYINGMQVSREEAMEHAKKVVKENPYV